MSKTPNIFVRSLRELKSTRCLALTALLIAMNIALDLMGLELRLPPDLKIGFGFLANAAVGMLFGPSVAMMAGVCTDLLGYIAGGLSMGMYFPGFTLTAVVAGLFWGLWLYPRRVSVWRAIGSEGVHQRVLQHRPEHLVADDDGRQGDGRAAGGCAYPKTCSCCRSRSWCCTSA